MSDDQIIDGIRLVLQRSLRLQRPISPQTDILRDLQLDSVQLLTLVVELENHFRVCFDPGDAEGVATVGELAALLHQRLEAEHVHPA